MVSVLMKAAPGPWLWCQEVRMVLCSLALCTSAVITSSPIGQGLLACLQNAPEQQRQSLLSMHCISGLVPLKVCPGEPNVGPCSLVHFLVVLRSTPSLKSGTWLAIMLHRTTMLYVCPSSRGLPNSFDCVVRDVAAMCARNHS